MSELQDRVEDIHDMFSDHLDIDRTDVREEFDQLTGEYSVPLEEAERAVVNQYRDEADLDDQEFQSGTEQILVNEIEEEDQWVDVEVQVTDLWEPRSDSVSQVGLIGDASGNNKFVSFETSDLEDLEEGASYRLSNVVTDEYQGDYSLKLNRTTEITKLEEDVEVGEQSTTVSGALVDLQSGSGLIKRCTEEGCSRTLDKGRCSEHGDVDYENDLRIMGALDTGSEVQTVVFDRELTSELADITLEEAVSRAKDAMDRDVVTEHIEKRVLGKYYTVSGPMIGDFLNVNSYELSGDTPEPEELLTQARSI